jgi:type IV secretory pathway VirB10-like protein
VKVRSRTSRTVRPSERTRSETMLVAIVGALVAVMSVAAPSLAQTYPPPPAPDQDTVLDGGPVAVVPPRPTRPPSTGVTPTDPSPEAPAPVPAPTPPAGPQDSAPPTTPSPEQPPQAAPVVTDDDGGPWAWLLAGVVVALASLFLLLGRRRSREDGTGNSGAAA